MKRILTVLLIAICLVSCETKKEKFERYRDAIMEINIWESHIYSQELQIDENGRFYLDTSYEKYLPKWNHLRDSIEDLMSKLDYPNNEHSRVNKFAKYIDSASKR